MSAGRAGALVAVRSRNLIIALGRGIRGWPGMDLIIVAYIATAVALYAHPWAYLFGFAVAVAVGVAWYASPARTWEAQRRRNKALSVRKSS